MPVIQSGKRAGRTRGRPEDRATQTGVAELTVRNEGVTLVAEVQDLNVNATGGTFTLTDGVDTTPALSYIAEELSVASVGTLTVAEDCVGSEFATGTLTIAEPVTSGDTLTIGSVVYTFKTDDELANKNEIAIGADEAATKVNIVAAINASGVAHTEYGPGTVANPLVTAAAFISDDMIMTAILEGIVANTMVFTETFTHASNVLDGSATFGGTNAGVTGDTITVGGVVYTVQETFVDEVNNIFAGADEAAFKVNLVAAINATGGTPGTTHATAQVANPYAVASTFSTDTMALTAQVPYAGTVGDDIVTAESFAGATNVWTDAMGETTAGVDGIDVIENFAALSAVTPVGNADNCTITFNDAQGPEALLVSDATLLTGGTGVALVALVTAGVLNVQHVVELVTEGNTGSFKITIDGNASAVIDEEDDADAIEVIVEGITGITAVECLGAGTRLSPFVITFETPGGAADALTITASSTWVSTVVDADRQVGPGDRE